MSQAQQKSRIVFRHPFGRFDVVETSGTGPLGAPFCVRTAVWTPERDTRGVIDGTLAEPLERKKDTFRPPVLSPRDRMSQKEIVMALDMYDFGYRIPKIARCLGKNVKAVYGCIWMREQEIETRKSRPGAGTPKTAKRITHL